MTTIESRLLGLVAAAIDRSVIVLHYEFKGMSWSQHVIDPGKFQDALREAARSAGGGRVECKTCGSYDAGGFYILHCKRVDCPHAAAPSPAPNETTGGPPVYGLEDCGPVPAAPTPSHPGAETAAGPQTGIVFSALGHEDNCEFDKGGVCSCPHSVLTGKSRLTEPGGRTGDEAGRMKPTVSRLESEASAPVRVAPQDGASPVPTLQDASHVPPLGGLCNHELIREVIGGPSWCWKCGDGFKGQSPSQEGRAGELRACPFCGAAARDDSGQFMESVRCANQGCPVKPHVIGDHARTSWNARAPLEADDTVGVHHGWETHAYRAIRKRFSIPEDTDIRTFIANQVERANRAESALAGARTEGDAT